ncbi:MAG: DNA ligase, partial [Planctomycetaceae bacterium]
MPDLADGETVEMQGSGAKPYLLKNTGGVFSCSCPAWRNQSIPIERRTCKHLKKLRGEAVELARVTAASPGLADSAASTAEGARLADRSSSGLEVGSEGSEVAGSRPPVELLLAEAWTGETEVTGWWMSEKLDGVRAYWTGKTFLSRLGNEFLAPAWFTAGLPEHPLDGELWLGRKAFQRAVSIVRRRDRSEHWRELRYVVFDLPELAAPFEERTRHLHDLLTRKPLEFVQPHPQTQCRGNDHLADELARVAHLGGEGLMLRQPGSLYVAGRSATLLKVKQFLEGEARVLEHLPGAGRHKGRLGAVLCELADGKRFSIGTGFSDEERRAPPPVGTLVQFRYQELSDAGIPRFPAYLGVRLDSHTASSSESLATASPVTGTPVKSTGTRRVAGKTRGGKPQQDDSAGKRADGAPSETTPTVAAAQ